MARTTTSNIGKGMRDTLTGFVRSVGTPDHEYDTSDQTFRATRYELLSSLASGVGYDDKDLWSSYKSHHGLYRHIRHLWDQAGPLVDFYAYRVWSGSIPDDGLRLPEGFINAIPFAIDTDTTLAAAAGALLQDWSFEDRMELLVRSVATLGEMLVELRDMPETGRVDLDFVWPAHVVDLSLNASGDVVSYAIEYNVREETTNSLGKTTVDRYKYRREVDKVSFRTFKDNKAFSYDGQPAVIENPYGFSPAVWFRHHRTLGVRGESAIAGTMGVTDEINSLTSHLLDKTHVALQAPVIVSGNLSMGSLYRAVGSVAQTVRRTITSAISYPNDLRQEQDILEAPAGTKVETIDVNIDSAIKTGEFLRVGAEKRVPETTVFEQLRKMTQITGPAAEALFGDVDPKYRTIIRGYDRQLEKALQMGITIAGWRVNQGDWNGTRLVNTFGETIDGLTERQTRFTSYNLGSYGQGKLILRITPRKLFVATQSDLLADIDVKARVLPFIPGDQLAKEVGYDQEQAKGWLDTYTAEQERIRQEDMAAQQANAAAKSQQAFGS